MTDPTAQAADTLWAAWTGGYQLAELPDEVRPVDAAAGWAVQRALAELAGPSYGYKIAATSAAGQAHIGVGGPLPGALFDRFRREPGAVLRSARLHMGVVEAEFAFRLASDVPAGATEEQVLAAVGALHLAIEVPDSRFEHFERAGEAQLLADVACAGWFVLGPAVPGWRELDLATAPTRLLVNGAEAATGSGAAVLGDPRTALGWLAGQLERFGTGLRAGDVVTTGTTTAPPAIGAGDAVRAEFGPLGAVELSFAR
ncbi:MAG TPA: fumarylacetoacetate hydrolase family protein [Pseudonocardia sp.]|jgi:2-keto-4-pentenoate hydratase|nr:fumarylacetoacetate hydrolase family protein [Pseudonocardia sp.]